jgi:glycosyltransferase involved in cell wall biosynthesis
MRILIVAMSDSIHTVRWLEQMDGKGWDIHLCPSIEGRAIHPRLKNLTVHKQFYNLDELKNRPVHIKGIPVCCGALEEMGRFFLRRLSGNYQARHLKRIVEQVKPDMVHTLEIQHSGYLTLAARRLIKGSFPPWIVTNWGSDIYLFGRLKAHKSRIAEVMAACDYYSCECRRDVLLAREFGFRGKVLMVSPNGGGFDMTSIRKNRQPGKTSGRRLIMVKGYQGWAGRGLVALRALERAADVLNGYEIVVYSASPEVVLATELLTDATGIRTTIVPHGSSHEEILRLHGKARISIGLSIGDAISTSLLEAMVMGSFPIQSWTSCANEWVDDGKTGILVPPEDSDVVESAIRLALKDDVLVDRAGDLNRIRAIERLDKRILKSRALEMYESIYKQRGGL